MFLDGLDRCSPGIRGRVLALLLERRVADVDLPHLVHRWASTGPPGTDVGGNAHAGRRRMAVEVRGQNPLG